MKTKFNYLFVLPMLLLSCAKQTTQQRLGLSPKATVQRALSTSGIPAFFANGADIGWVSQMEAAGKVFYNRSGVQEDCLQIL